MLQLCSILLTFVPAAIDMLRVHLMLPTYVPFFCDPNVHAIVTEEVGLTHPHHGRLGALDFEGDHESIRKRENYCGRTTIRQSFVCPPCRGRALSES